jgi:hypothetical protein
MRMHLAQEEVPEDKQQALPKMPLKTFDNRICVPARWALVIAVFHEYGSRIFVTLPVILRTNANGKLTHINLLLCQFFKRLEYSVCSWIHGDR